MKRIFVEKIDSMEDNLEEEQKKGCGNADIVLSPFFQCPLWKKFFDLECELNVRLSLLTPPSEIKYIYNPLEYAADLHCAYLQRFLDGPKRLVFVGMNPGPNGMGQTGIPFGNIKTIRDLMGLTGRVDEPPIMHPKRLVKGLNCTTEEPSGVRIWTLFHSLAGSLDNFFMQCFVHNFCPLIFLSEHGKNITPSELKGDYKSKIRDVCLDTLYKQLELLEPEIIVAVGDYISTCLKNYKKIPVLKMPHPSPRAVNNTNWLEKAENFLKDNDLVKYIKNQV